MCCLIWAIIWRGKGRKGHTSRWRMHCIHQTHQLFCCSRKMPATRSQTHDKNQTPPTHTMFMENKKYATLDIYSPHKLPLWSWWWMGLRSMCAIVICGQVLPDFMDHLGITARHHDHHHHHLRITGQIWFALSTWSDDKFWTSPKIALFDIDTLIGTIPTQISIKLLRLVFVPSGWSLK